MEKMDELVKLVKKAEAKAKEEKCCDTMKTILKVIGFLAIVAAVVYAVYKFVASLNKDEDEFYEDEDIFEDEDSCIELQFASAEQKEEASVEAEEETTADETKEAEEEVLAEEAEETTQVKAEEE